MIDDSTDGCLLHAYENTDSETHVFGPSMFSSGRRIQVSGPPILPSSRRHRYIGSAGMRNALAVLLTIAKSRLSFSLSLSLVMREDDFALKCNRLLISGNPSCNTLRDTTHAFLFARRCP